MATQPCFGAFTGGRRRRDKCLFGFWQEKAKQSGHLCWLTGSPALGQGWELSLSQHQAKGECPRGNATTSRFGLGRAFAFWGRLRSTRWGRLEVLQGEGTGGGSWKSYKYKGKAVVGTRR